ncbi:hypothetical protein HAX54_042124 [Datura stramonium]|uniref:Peptidase C1A papain C-terminal domain-containing protein n=1 Tax=Datura stramonium TaxID=4076 RepID=A0ABS8SM08_DATST|nr:hypothetical protein [Datura stramonium]
MVAIHIGSLHTTADDQHAIDEEFNLRGVGTLYPFVRDHGQMNSCYTYSSTEAMSALYAAENEEPHVELSTQQLVDHFPIVFDYANRRNKRDRRGCYFGSHIDVFRYAMNVVVCSEGDYPKRGTRWDEDVIYPIPNENVKYLVGSFSRVHTGDHIDHPDFLSREDTLVGEDYVNAILMRQSMVGAIRIIKSFQNFRGQLVKIEEMKVMGK